MSKKFRIIYRSLLLCLLAYGLAACFIGWLAHKYNQFYIYYTNQSNIICFIIIATLLIYDIKNKDTVKFTKIQFLASIWILITCLVYNVLLGDIFSSKYWMENTYNYLLHLFCPILFILDFYLFSKKNQLKSWTPLLCVTYPYIYIIFILIRASFYKLPPKGIILYPYFFLDLANLGVIGFIRWIGILTIAFVSLGYIMKFIYNFKR